MEGQIILVDKPKGITSFDVIRILRRKLGIKKMGHAGTLDPLATGLMIIATNSFTKKLTELLGLPKVYSAEILLGTKTESADVDGKIIETQPVPELTVAQIEKVLQTMQGDIELAVPIYSAIKRQGKPLYEYAREGIAVEVPKKIMHITYAKVLDYTAPVIRIEFEVKSGTYIRSLAEELARRLGTVGTIQNLRRTSIGEFKVEGAMVLE